MGSEKSQWSPTRRSGLQRVRTSTLGPSLVPTASAAWASMMRTSRSSTVGKRETPTPISRSSASSHFTFVSEVERGERNLSLSSLLRLAEGLDVDPGELVSGLHWETS